MERFSNSDIKLVQNGRKISSQFVKQSDELHAKRLRWRIKENLRFLIKIRKFILFVFQNDLFKSPVLQQQRQVAHSRHWKFETISRWLHEKVVNFKSHVSHPKVSRSLWSFTLRRSLKLATFHWRETRKKSNLRLSEILSKSFEREGSKHEKYRSPTLRGGVLLRSFYPTTLALHPAKVRCLFPFQRLKPLIGFFCSVVKVESCAYERSIVRCRYIIVYGIYEVCTIALNY